MTPFGQTSTDLHGQVSAPIGARALLPFTQGAGGGAVRIQLPPLPPASKAGDCCGALLAIHAAAIRQNLDCVLTSVDPEGPHQLRVALRRLRVMLRTFRPVVRAAKAEPIVDAARKIGAIAGELRDADVLIDEMIRPAGDMFSALNDWRNEVRGRVRARLVSVDAAQFAAGLAETAGGFAWRKRSARAKACLATELVGPFVERGGKRVARAAARLPQLSAEQVHEVRKEVKALRYAVELADALSITRDADLASSLKRAQDALGYINDVATLERFAPPLGGARFVELRARLVADKAAAVAENTARALNRLEGIEKRCAAL